MGMQGLQHGREIDSQEPDLRKPPQMKMEMGVQCAFGVTHILRQAGEWLDVNIVFGSSQLGQATKV